MKNRLLLAPGLIVAFAVLFGCVHYTLVYFIDYDMFDRSGWHMEKDGAVRFLDYHGEPVLGWHEVDGVRYYLNPQQGGNKTTGWLDMYPQYWTPSIGGIFMKYSYEFKLMCVDMYRQGKWPDTPKGIKDKTFHDKIRVWVRQEDACGEEILRHKSQNKVWSAEEKYELVAQVLAGKSCKELAISHGINYALLYQWVNRYKMKGYEGLVSQRKGRPPKEPDMKKKVVPAELTPSEREEMIRLRAENERMRAEIAVIKKEIALREERYAAQLKAKKQRSSKNSVKKDIP